MQIALSLELRVISRTVIFRKNNKLQVVKYLIIFYLQLNVYVIIWKK